MSKRNKSLRGSATLEFTLVGIPLIFILISIVEISRGMWTYHTLAHAIKEGTRYAIVHGENAGLIAGASHGTYQSVCNVIAQTGSGLLPQSLQLTFTSASGTTGPGTALDCMNGVGQFAGNWPPSPDDQPGNTIVIKGYYPFLSALSMFWPGAGKGTNFVQLTCSGGSTVCLPAGSSDVMQF